MELTFTSYLKWQNINLVSLTNQLELKMYTIMILGYLHDVQAISRLRRWYINDLIWR